MIEQISGNTGRFVVYAIVTLSILLLSLMIYYLINIGNRFIEGDKRIKIDLKLIIKIFIAIVILYLVTIIFEKYTILGYTLWSLIIGIIFAYVIDPIVNFLERKGIKRPFGVIIVYITTLIVFAILLVTVIPKTITEITNLLASLPPMIDSMSRGLTKFFYKLAEDYNINLPPSFLNMLSGTTDGVSKSAKLVTNSQDPLTNMFNSFSNAITNILDNVQKSALDSLRSVVVKLYGLVTSTLKIVLVLIFSFYFSIGKEKYLKSFKKSIPNKYRDDVNYLAVRINTSLQQFIRGRLLLALFVGFLTMIYLLILRVDFAIVIGMITCIADIIPYIGPFLGFVPAVLFAFMDAPLKALWVSILFIIIQWAENNILAPKLIGDSTGLNPLAVLISIIIGGGIFGIWGMVVSVPLVSIILILLDFFKLKYNENKVD
ncbi:AI-2E family transporter [Peptoniphilus lacrimalis]|uniref:AI-2E family transporter n=1 Tax=Peptoniphilus lacrimalis TaxID=33031 RepID=UPI00254DE488|nr:AI-2E family transporter [Peptoniphilus lacrimalis]MDK7722303.1 AI-2E family transporter [Peptoniphilus lacrimalis]MDK7731905.1 AI-2E family transporter [Peptoniphilus lacrimalis]MDK8281501.1 AI-2E family transporter [Peptoniphilus lacrimalis]